MREEREARIDEGKARARIILEERRERALRLIAHLIEHSHVNEPEFLRLMNGEEARPGILLNRGCKMECSVSAQS